MSLTSQSLTTLRSGDRARVQGFSATMPTDCRKLLQHLGITRQAEIILVRRAPLGDPLQLQISGSQISLRAQEAQHIYVQRLTKPYE
jgi:ferrous iron transport protein A